MLDFQTSSSETQQTLNSRILFFLSLCLAVLCLIPFYQTLNFDFLTIDDNLYITDNPVVRSGLSWSSIKWAFTSLHGGNWHPVTSIFMMAEVSLFGVNAMGFHAINVLIHTVNAILLFLILSRSTKLALPAFFVACFFAVHPTRAESVAWIVELKDVLSTLFIFWAILLYIKHGKASRLSIFGVYILSLMSKQMYVTLPILLLILDFWPLQRFSREKLVALAFEKIPYLAMGLIASKFALAAQAACGALSSFESCPLDLRFKNAAVAFVKYIIKMFALFMPSGFYDPYEKSYPLTLWLPCLLTLITTTMIVYYFRKNKPYLLSGWLLFIMALMPVIGIVQISTQSMADRFTYFPYIGLFIMIFYFLYNQLNVNKIGRYLFIVGGIVTSLAAASACHIQTSYWKNSTSLFKRAVIVNPRNYSAHLLIGESLYYEDKNPKDAKIHLLQALALRPSLASAHNVIGQIQSAEGDYVSAKKSFESAVFYDPNNADLEANLATLYSYFKKNDLSLIHYKKALQINSNLTEAYSGLLSYARNTCDFGSIEEYLPRIFSLQSSSPSISSLVDWYEKLSGNTLLEKKKSCKEIMDLEEKQRKELEEINKVLAVTETLKQVSQVQKVYKIY